MATAKNNDAYKATLKIWKYFTEGFTRLLEENDRGEKKKPRGPKKRKSSFKLTSEIKIAKSNSAFFLPLFSKNHYIKNSFTWLIRFSNI